jgi:GT2 family glycosyltransferase
VSSVDLSIVVLSWNTQELTLACLRALEADASARTREVIVVDNGSEDGSPDAIAATFPAVTLIRNADNRLYAAANNQGAREARGRWLCILNSDTEVRPGALDRMVDFLEQHPEYGAVGPKLTDPDGSAQKTCTRFPGLHDVLVDSTPLQRFPPGSWRVARTRMADFDHISTRDVDQPPGACMVLARDEYLALGGLDEDLSLFFNDVDLCKRLWQGGRRIRYLSEAEVVHVGGASTRKRRGLNTVWFQNRAAYYRKHHGFVGLAWTHFVLLLWATQVGFGITLGRKKLPEKRVALGELGTHLRRCLAA